MVFEPLKVIHLLPEHELKPIHSFDELPDALLSAVEKLCDANEFERLSDGLSRLCDQRPTNYSTRIAPLLKRLDKLSNGFFDSLYLPKLRERVKRHGSLMG